MGKKNKVNTIGYIFAILGYVIIGLGLVIGFGILKNPNFNLLFVNRTYFVICFWISAFLTGMLFIAIGEHLRLMQEISNNTESPKRF